MRTILPVLMLFAAAAPAPAALSAERGPVPFVTPALREGLAEIRSQTPRWAQVHLRVRSGGSSFLEVSETSLRVSLNGSRDSSGYFRFNGRVGDRPAYYNASPSWGTPPQSYTLWGGGAHLTLERRGADSWHAYGSVDAKSLSFSISRWASGGYQLWGLNGANLQGHASGDMVYVNGSMDLSRAGPKELSLLGAALAVAHASPGVVQSAAPESAAKAVWKPYTYDGPRYRHSYDCIPALHAVTNVLSMMDARVRRKHCSGLNGLVAEWESLAPAEGASGAVDAVWTRANLQVSMSDPRGCWIYSETLDYLLYTLPIRKPSQSVFCQQGGGFISVSFEYLAPAQPARAPGPDWAWSPKETGRHLSAR